MTVDPKMKDRYQNFCKLVKHSANSIDLKHSVKRKRKGIGGFIDTAVFFKSSFLQAEGWAKLPYALVFWLSLTPLAITNANLFLNYFGIDFQIPLDWGSIMAIILVIGLMIFGILAHTKFGTVKSQLELTNRQNPSFFAVYNQIEDMKEELKEEIKKEIRKEVK